MRYLAICLVAVAGLVGRSEGQGQDLCRADFNDDGVVNYDDFLFFVQAFSPENPLNCEGYSLRDTVKIVQRDTIIQRVVDTLVVADTSRIVALTKERDDALADALKWKSNYDGLKEAYDYNRVLILEDPSIVRNQIIDVLINLPDSARSRVRNAVFGECTNTTANPSPPTPPSPPPSPPPTSNNNPDLIVESPSVSDSALTPGQSFTLDATVRNRGTAEAAATTLRYYQSSDATITTNDTEAGKDNVNSLAPSNGLESSVRLTAPSREGTFYYGACVASVSGESNTNNNCSDGVRVTVEVSSGGGGSDSGGSGSESVEIPDESLRTVILNILGKAHGAPITRADMATLTQINAITKNIRNLTGLEFATNLEQLDLRHNRQISDITALSGLTNLTGVWLSDNQISDIAALSGLTNLTWLSLDRNQISDSDMTVLSGLTNLTQLDLGYNQIEDISALSGLTNLTSLILYGNQISDITALSGLTNLTYLYIQNNQISDITALSGLTKLITLSLGGNPLSATSRNTHIPAHRARGVEVLF